jgi:hypothetical protein
MPTPIKETIFKTWDNTPYPTQQSHFTTKMYSFGGPGGKKNIHKIYLTATAGVAKLHVYYRTELSPTEEWRQFGTVNISSNGGDTYELLPDNPSNLKGVNSIQFLFSLWSTASSGLNVLTIDDINIVYRAFRQLSIEED